MPREAIPRVRLAKRVSRPKRLTLQLSRHAELIECAVEFGVRLGQARSSKLLGSKDVALTSSAVNQRFLAFDINFLSKSLDVLFNQVRERIIRLVPNPFRDRIAIE